MNYQLSRISDAINITNNQQNLPVRRHTGSTFNVNVSPDPNDQPSTFTQTNFTEQILGMLIKIDAHTYTSSYFFRKNN